MLARIGGKMRRKIGFVAGSAAGLLLALQAIPAARFGTPEEFGEVCAFVCSVQASYLVGQNLLLDGGNYPGTF